MRLQGSSGSHLTYCTNIHPGETWAEVRGNLKQHVSEVRDLVAPDTAFGVGLRLSATATETLQQQAAYDELEDLLKANRLYVFTLNGFPYGAFHGAPVKEAVYLPDWQDPERLRYTDRLADLLARLLPDEPGLYGSVSTVPGAFKPRANETGALERIADAMLRHVAHLVGIERKTGRIVVLALEPEPCCLLETVEETVAFFKQWLFGPDAVARLTTLGKLTPAAAEEALHRHIGVCFDTCHAAVEFESAAGSVHSLQGAGIRIAKLQLSVGLQVNTFDRETLAELMTFGDEVYLHQVVERASAGLTRFVDLPDALASLEDAKAGSIEREWRVHFHVPVFLGDMGQFSNTQPFLRDILALHRKAPVSPHLEVETYTWNVLPERYREVDVSVSIARELSWVINELEA
jgi:sugar phosphate isomerase/epimerase